MSATASCGPHSARIASASARLVPGRTANMLWLSVSVMGSMTSAWSWSPSARRVSSPAALARPTVTARPSAPREARIRRISLNPAIGNDHTPVVDELERLMADVGAVELGAVGEDDGSAAFDAVDENRGGQVIEAWASGTARSLSAPSHDARIVDQSVQAPIDKPSMRTMTAASSVKPGMGGDGRSRQDRTSLRVT